MTSSLIIRTGHFLAVILLGFSQTVVAQDSGLSTDPGWGDVSAVRMDVEFPGDGYHANWLLNRCDCGDLLIESELNVPGEVEKGELLLVGQRAVMERGFRSKEFETQMSWDAPALMLQLAGQLLTRSIPAGPASVNEQIIVSVSDDQEGIALDSGNAVGGFPAPWEVTTLAEPDGENRRRFDLQFTFGIPGSTEKAHMRLKGTADYSEREFPLDENTPLEGWHLTWRNAEDPAIRVPGLKTLADLRAVIIETEQGGSVSPPQ